MAQLLNSLMAECGSMVWFNCVIFGGSMGDIE